jgi:transcriptional regulator with XRE-family HTH domain
MDTRQMVLDRIIELCKAKRWAFNALANFSGIHPSTMKNIISGRSANPGIVTIKKICDGLEISLAEFFDTEGFRSLEQENE